MQTRNKIISYRTCLYCNKQFNKDELIRLVKSNGKLVIDVDKNKPGRGYWIKLSDQALNDKKLSLILSKRTKSNISQDLINQLNELWKRIK